MAPAKRTNRDPEYRQAIVVQLAAFGLFGFLAFTGVIDLNSLSPSLLVGLLILAIAAGVPSDLWVGLLRWIIGKRK